MKKTLRWMIPAALAVGGMALAGSLIAAARDRADCPGKIVCPISGEVICADRCPLTLQEAAPETAAEAPAGGCCENR